MTNTQPDVNLVSSEHNEKTDPIFRNMRWSSRCNWRFLLLLFGTSWGRKSRSKVFLHCEGNKFWNVREEEASKGKNFFCFPFWRSYSSLTIQLNKGCTRYVWESVFARGLFDFMCLKVKSALSSREDLWDDFPTLIFSSWFREILWLSSL